MSPWTPVESTSTLPLIGAEESEHLDFKRSPWGSSDGDKVELACDVAQFANHLGGSIVVGADEQEQRLSSFVGVEDCSELERKVMDTCYARLSPRVQVRCLTIRTSAGPNVLAINVQPSIGPVGVRVRQGRWDFFRRDGKGKKPMEFEEVEQMRSHARRGRILLSRIPEQEFVYLDAAEIDPALMRAPCRVRCSDDHFAVTLNTARVLNFPYEFVKAACPRSGGGWYLALAVRFFYDEATSGWGASHVF